ncbi:hypothetical protein HO173_003495 [Letharia columbiana]|uniref:Uncharacterized protein n=1 Tax=Letharia columbiana TaxID=112416 RepID=A0A8H6L7H7_9LECA|nr:uncharacterized protein HO173_003495 [Letharia columbiana]KAF6238526.1 hypothetical protein HO173_003495 [Letharia columbiana]
MNTIVLGTPRGNVTKRFRHVHPFCPPLRAPTDAPRPPLGESATAGNRGRKRAQQLPTTAHRRVRKPSKRARTDSQPSSSPTYYSTSRSVNTTYPISSVIHSIRSSAKEEQEEEIQQANAENTAEKPSGNKAPSTKNTAQLSKIPRYMLSTVPHQIITQQAENTTATWPVIPTALIWYINAITSQEEDLLRRSQSIKPLQEEHRKRRNYNRQMRKGEHCGETKRQ